MNERRTIGFALLALCLAGCPGKPPAADQFHGGSSSTVNGSGGNGGGGLGGGGSGGNGVGGSGGDTCGDVQATIFMSRCGMCHGPNQPAQGLDLVSAGLAARVLGQASQGACGGLLVDPQHPEQSMLYDKLLDVPGCGQRMPPGPVGLSTEEIACVRAWIAAQ